MHHRTHICLIVTILVLLTACPAGAVRLKSIELATDVSGDGFTAVNVVEGFTTDIAEIHGIAHVEGTQANSIIRGVWVSIDAISIPNYEIASAEVNVERNGPASAHFALSRPTNGWPQGNYRLDVYLGDQLIGSKGFPMAAATVAAPTASPVATAPVNDQAQIQKKLQALQAAHEAGILSDEEYAQKKAAMEAQLQGPSQNLDSETRKRLEALESAYEAGILSQQEYQQKKNALLQNATASQPVVAEPQVQTRQESAPKAGRTYAHPAGFSFWYPASWNLTDQEGMVQLTPHDAAQSPDGPLELYFLVTEDISGQGITRPTDPMVIQYLDEQVKSLSPILAYDQRPSTLQTDVGQGAVLLWQATAPDGTRIVARVFVVFARETAVMLIGMGLKERIDARDTDLRDLFQSVTTGQVRAPRSVEEPPQRPQVTAPPQQSATPDPQRASPQITQQLRALEAAREAGVISEQEYADKKKSLQDKQSQAIDPVTRQKLEAIESAYKAGILSQEEYERKKAQLTGQTPDEPSQQGGQPLGTGVSPKVGGQTYRHVLGLTFWHPADWAIKEHEEMLQLIPPNASMTASGDPTEIYLIIGDNTVGDEGIVSADDPRVAQFMDQAVAQLAPLLRRSGAPVPMSTATGKGVRMDWQGTSPNGDVVCARAHICVMNDFGIALVALCLKDRLTAREAELQRIFTSFAFGQAQRDVQLVGTWNFLTTHAITNWSPFETSYSRAQMASDTTGTLVIRPDGTWMRQDKTHMIAGAGGVWLESKDTQESKGTWYAGNGSLHLIWDDKSWQEYKYEMRQTPQGVRLLLTSGGKGELWERTK